MVLREAHWPRLVFFFFLLQRVDDRSSTHCFLNLEKKNKRSAICLLKINFASPYPPFQTRDLVYTWRVLTNLTMTQTYYKTIKEIY